MTPHEFIQNWRAAVLEERSVSQSHFNHLFRLLGIPEPIADAPDSERLTF